MTGYGSIRAVPAIETIQSENVVEAELVPAEVWRSIVVVGPTDTELRVTIAWDDPFGTPNVSPVLVNDLDLRVVDSGRQRPPARGPSIRRTRLRSRPCETGAKDSLNNIEQVTVDAPAPGAYLIEVEGVRIAEGASQSFGLAASPNLSSCSSAGFLSTDRTRVSCEGQLGLGILDCDLNSSAGVINNVDVSLESQTDPEGDDVTLQETGLDTGNFSGTVPVSLLNAVGVVQVVEG